MQYPYESLFMEMGLGEPIAASELASSNFDPAGSFAIDAWVNLSDCNTTKRLISKQGCFSLHICKDRVEFCAEGYTAVTAEEPILSRAWVYVAVSCYKGNVRIFLDGSLVADKIVSGTSKTSAKQVEIGRDFFGSMRLLRVYKSALTAQDVEEMMYQQQLTTEMSAFYDFTRNPAKELKGAKALTLPDSCSILCAMPSARYENGAYLDISQNESVNPAGKRNAEYTVQMWVWIDPALDTPVCTLFYNADPGGRLGMELCLVRNGTEYHLSASHCILDDAAYRVESPRAVPKGEWHNLAVTWRNNFLILFVDGDLAARKIFSDAPSNALTHKKTFLGAGATPRNPNGEKWFSGYISRADVWDKALTADRLKKYASAEPDWNAAGLTGSWSFFTNYMSNRVDSTPVARINELRVRENRMPAIKGQCEQVFTPVRDSLDPLSAEQLAQCRERAMGKGGVTASEGMTLRANTCVVDERVYFVLHDATRSYTVCHLSAQELADDPMLQWEIELILILLGAVVSLLFSISLTYNAHLGTFLRLEVATNPQILIQLAAVKGVSSAATFIVAFLKQLLSENKMWQLLCLCVQVGFWAGVCAITKIAARVLGGPASWAAWLLLTGGAIVYHLTKMPARLPDLTITSILFSHRQPGSVCSINIRKNQDETWARPEWQPDTQTLRVPAVYRISRFLGNNDPLTIGATFESGDYSPHAVLVRALAVGANATLLGDTNTVSVALQNGVSGTVYFTLGAHSLRNGGIQMEDVSWKWQYQKNGFWEDIKITNHKVFTILDSVHLPWSAIPDQVNNPWTDCLELAYNWIAGIPTKQGVSTALTTMLYNSGRVRYAGNATYATAGYIEGAMCKAFYLVDFMDGWNAGGVLNFNCEDCADFMITFANLLGCDLWQVGLGAGFAVPQILLIGERIWRFPNDEHLGPGYFSYHVVACEAQNNAAGLDPTLYLVYDPCMQYHDAAQNVILAQGARLSQYQTLPPVPIAPPPRSGFYREDLLANTAQGIGKCALVQSKRLYLA